MRVTQVTFHADSGGAGIAAARLVAALREYSDVELDYAVVDPGSCRFARKLASPFRRAAMRLKSSWLYRTDRRNLPNSAGGRIYNFFPGHLVEAILTAAPDVVHLHSIVGEMLSISEIGELARRVPVVWTLHDMWPFCGCEQYALDDRFVTGYAPTADRDARAFASKLREWSDIKLHLVAPSNFMGDCARRSRLLKNQDIRVIGNTLDTRIFAPGNREEARAAFGIAPDRPVVAIGGADPGNANKSFHLPGLLAQLEKLLPEAIILTAGGLRPATQLTVRSAGRITAAEQLVKFYRAADFFCVPSRIDNLPNMALESLACGTPVAAVSGGGIGDLVNAETGILAADGAELGTRLAAALVSPDPRLREGARRHVETCFSPEIIARRHAELYRDLQL